VGKKIDIEIVDVTESLGHNKWRGSIFCFGGKRKMATDKKSLEATLKAIRKTYGEGSIFWLDGRGHPARKIEVIPTGCLALDIALGAGGFPRGRIIEIFGGEGVGKSSMCLHAIAAVQQRGGTAAFIDVENSLDPGYSEALGVNLGDVLITQPDSGEQAMDIADKLIRSGDIDIVVIDSVAALLPRAELAGQIGDAHVGLQARLVSQSCRILSSAIAKSNTMVILTNQMRSKIATSRFGPTTTTSGGMALGYYASVRLQLWAYGKIEDGDDKIGAHVKVRVVKNKIAPPFREAEFDLIFGRGIVRSLDLINTGKAVGVVEQKGAWISFEDENIGQGLLKSSKALEDDVDLANRLEDSIREKAGLPLRFVEDLSEEANNE